MDWEDIPDEELRQMTAAPWEQPPFERVLLRTRRQAMEVK